MSVLALLAAAWRRSAVLRAFALIPTTLALSASLQAPALQAQADDPGSTYRLGANDLVGIQVFEAPFMFHVYEILMPWATQSKATIAAVSAFIDERLEPTG
jgi:hypothetical protein